MSWFLVAPLAIPLATAAVALFAWRAPKLQRLASIAGSVGLLIASLTLLAQVLDGGILAAQMGTWPAPFGITLVADHLSAVMVAVTGVMGCAVLIFGLADIDDRRVRLGFHPLFHCLLLGVCGAFLTGDVFNLYVWFEVMLIASFALLALGGESAQLDGAIKYAWINLISTAAFLLAVGLLYGMTGTLNMADLSVALPAVEDQALVTAVAGLFMVAFGVKAAVFPLFFWLPASYHTPPVTVSAIFAALLTKVGVYALIRVFTLLFTNDIPTTHTLLLWAGGLTMVTGVIGAAAQNDIRRILSFHIISQIGYMIMGLALFTPLALAGALIYMVHNIVAKTNLFLIGGVIERSEGTGALKALGGWYALAPLVAITFLISALALAGLPPLSGFWAKLVLIRAGLEEGFYVISGAALLVGILTLFSMTKIWLQVFWKPHPVGQATGLQPLALGQQALMMGPILFLLVPMILFGLWPEPFFAVAERAGNELMNPDLYRDAVLGVRP